MFILLFMFTLDDSIKRFYKDLCGSSGFREKNVYDKMQKALTEKKQTEYLNKVNRKDVNVGLLKYFYH